MSIYDFFFFEKERKKEKSTLIAIRVSKPHVNCYWVKLPTRVKPPEPNQTRASPNQFELVHLN